MSIMNVTQSALQWLINKVKEQDSEIKRMQQVRYIAITPDAWREVGEGGATVFAAIATDVYGESFEGLTGIPDVLFLSLFPRSIPEYVDEKSQEDNTNMGAFITLFQRIKEFPYITHVSSGDWTRSGHEREVDKVTVFATQKPTTLCMLELVGWYGDAAEARGE